MLWWSVMPRKLLHAHVVRRLATIQDEDGRGYLLVEPDDVRQLGLAAGYSWWWCVLPLRRHRYRHHGDVPQPGSVVAQYTLQRIGTGFERGRTVGVVELR